MRKVIVAGTVMTAMVAIALVGIAGASHSDVGVKTAKQPFLVGTAAGVQVDPILSVGEIVPNGQNPDYQMTGIPDGLGAYKKGNEGRWHWFHSDKSNRAVVVMNHELGRSFPNNPPGVDARISRLEVDTRTHRVHLGEYLFTGLEGYERFCSSTLRMIRGKPLYFAGEEAVPIAGQPPGPAHDGSSIVMDPETGMWRDLGHMGHLQHENLLPLQLKKWVFVTTDDDFRPGQPAYFYGYFNKSFDLALRGLEHDPDDGLHVFVPDPGEEKSNAEVMTKSQVVHGRFVKLTQAENATSTSLKAAATAKGAFVFDRLEDMALMPNRESRVFIAETGKPPATLRGRIYQFDFDRNNPYRASMRMILNGDGASPNGGDDIYNPDNMDASERVLMIQEDRESAFRDEPFSGGYARVMEYRFSDGNLRSVARVNTTPGTPPGSMTENCAGCRRGTWESSGIIDVGHIFGRDWWLLDVQAHNSTAPQPGPTLVPNSSTGENGQLLLLKVPGSQGGGGGHHDDDDDDDDDD
jgi:hypothetical protein